MQLLTAYPIFAQQFILTKDFLNLEKINPNLFSSYKNIKISEAWNIVESINPIFIRPIKIGIIDSGIDDKHPEFHNVNLGNTPLSAKFDHDLLGHGTQISGIIGANNISIISSQNYITPQMNGIVSGIKNLDYVIEHRYDGGLNLFKILFNIFELAAIENVDVINISSAASHSICNAILLNSAEGIFFAAIAPYIHTLFITSAGETLPNVSDAECFLPGALGGGLLSLSNVINVGGLDSTVNNRWPNSPFGSAVNISAPAVNVYAPRPPQIRELEGQYDQNFSGTSASAPMVAGVAAILKAIKPELTPSEIKDILQKSADPIITDKPLGSGCFDPNNNPQGFNGCRLNALEAVCHFKVLNCLRAGSPLIRNLPLGYITTVAGSGGFGLSLEGFSGDGGPAIAARFFQPVAVVLDKSGNLFVADWINHRIRKVDAKTGIITTVAGSGNTGQKGDNGPAIEAELAGPFGVAIDSAGNLFIADTFNHRVRAVRLVP